MGWVSELKKFGRRLDREVFRPIFQAIIPPEPEVPDTPGPQGSAIQRDPTDQPLNVIIGDARRFPVRTAVFEDVVDPNNGDDIKNDLYLAFYLIGEPIRSVSTIYVNDVPIDDERYRRNGKTLISAFIFTAGLYNKIRLGKWLSKTRFDKKSHRFTRIALLYFFANWDPDKFTGLGRLSIDAKGYPLKSLSGGKNTHEVYFSCFAHTLAELITNTIWGFGDSRSSIDMSSFTYAAQVYSQHVPRHEHTTETEVLNRCDTVIDTSKTVLSNIKTLLAGCLSYLVYRDGKHYLIPQTQVTPVDFQLSDGSKETPHRILERTAISTGNTNERYNQVEVKYRDYRTGRTQSVFYPRTDSDEYRTLLTEDGQKRLNKTFTLHTCNRPTEALRYARYQLLTSRNNLAFSVDCRADCIGLQIGDVVPVTIEDVGFNQKPFRIVGRALEGGFVSLDLEEYQDRFFDWKNENPPEIPDTELKDPTHVTPPSDIRSEFIEDGGVLFSWFSAHQNFEIMIERQNQRFLVEQIVTRDYHLKRALSPGYYVLKVRAHNGYYWSSFAAYTFRLTQPVAPTVIVLSASADAIILQASVQGQGRDTRFEFQYRGVDGAFEGAIVEANPFTAGALKASTTYHFRVRSKNPVGISDWTPVIAATTENAPIQALRDDLTEITRASLARLNQLQLNNLEHNQTLTEIDRTIQQAQLGELAQLAEKGQFDLSYERLSASLGQIRAQYARLAWVKTTLDGAFGRIKETLDLRFDNNAAVWSSVIEGVVTDTSAALRKAEELAAKVVKPDGSLSEAVLDSVQTVIVNDENGAISEHITNYTVEHAGKKVSIQTVAGASISPDGNTFASQFGAFEDLENLKNGLGFFRQNNKTKVVLSAQELVFYNASSHSLADSPFEIIGDVTYLKEASIKSLDASKISGDISSINSYPIYMKNDVTGTFTFQSVIAKFHVGRESFPRNIVVPTFSVLGARSNLDKAYTVSVYENGVFKTAVGTWMTSDPLFYMWLTTAEPISVPFPAHHSATLQLVISPYSQQSSDKFIKVESGSSHMIVIASRNTSSITQLPLT